VARWLVLFGAIGLASHLSVASIFLPHLSHLIRSLPVPRPAFFALPAPLLLSFIGLFIFHAAANKRPTATVAPSRYQPICIPPKLLHLRIPLIPICLSTVLQLSKCFQSAPCYTSRDMQGTARQQRGRRGGVPGTLRQRGGHRTSCLPLPAPRCRGYSSALALPAHRSRPAGWAWQCRQQGVRGPCGVEARAPG